MNTSINISLPESLKEYIKQRVAQEGYSTPSDFIRDLIREDKRRQEQVRLERLLLEGLESGSERLTPEE